MFLLPPVASSHGTRSWGGLAQLPSLLVWGILPLRKWYFPSLDQALRVEQVSSQLRGKEGLVLTVTCPYGLQSGMSCQPEGK